MLTILALVTLLQGSGSSSASPLLGQAGGFSTVSKASAGGCQPSWLPTFGASELDDSVSSLAVFDDGSGNGPALYVGGHFTHAGALVTNGIARWDGTSWSALGNGMYESPINNAHVAALAVFDEGGGAGPTLFAAGRFTEADGVEALNIARWDGASWSPVGGGTDRQITALAVFDDGSGSGPALYAGGFFTSVSGMTARRIAKWDGTSWSPLGLGMQGGAQGVFAMEIFDDGSGAALHAGGYFFTAGGVAANGIAKWDGTNWSPLGSGMDSRIQALKVFDDGSGGGPALYAGGYFTSAGGVAASRIAKWDGASWSPLASGMNDLVLALTVFDDGGGAGPALLAGGAFTAAGGVAASRIARWNGSSWSPLANGTNGSVEALTPFNAHSGLGPALLAGGAFTNAGDSGDSFLARWQGCDSFPPTLLCPPSIVAIDEFSGPPGEVVTFSIPASDDSDPAPSVVCVPASGSFFPRGTTLVTCTATDAAGNHSSCDFPLTVQFKARKR